ncbi:MAG: gluconokinase [Hydrogenobaculum sp.]|nr:MAG: gluconokinase [Hydrogenobaculum sp.]
MSEVVFYLKDKLKGELIQTHSSFVIITDDVVYKIKKPVNFGFLDYSTLEKRKLYSYKELEINKRLCSDIYIDVLPISKIDDGYEFSDKNIVEYAVKMKRVNDELFMINRLKDLTNKDIENVAKRVARFHLETKKVYDFDVYNQMKFNTDENFEQTKEFIGKTIEQEDYDFIKDKVNSFYQKHKDLFYKRQKEGYVVDGHGDIRLEHVVMVKDICIMDAIEFNDRFRIQDQINDMCFLSMELELKGYKDFAKTYEDTYKNATKDKDFEIFLDFYKCYRAYVRGKVTSFLLNDPHVENKDSVVESAKRFFKLAKEYATNVV